MRGGKNRKLPALRAIEGNPGKRPIPEVPKIPRATTAAPVTLTDPVALAYWDEHWPLLLNADIVTAADRAAFARCCEWWAESCDREGYTRRLEAHKQWLRLASNFGLTPLDRVRLAKPAVKKEPGTKWGAAL